MGMDISKRKGYLDELTSYLSERRAHVYARVDCRVDCIDVIESGKASLVKSILSGLELFITFTGFEMQSQLHSMSTMV